MVILEQKFDDIKLNGLLMPTAQSSAQSNSDEIDNVGQLKANSRLVKRTLSANVRKLDVQGIFFYYSMLSRLDT